MSKTRIITVLRHCSISFEIYEKECDALFSFVKNKKVSQLETVENYEIYRFRNN